MRRWVFVLALFFMVGCLKFSAYSPQTDEAVGARKPPQLDNSERLSFFISRRILQEEDLVGVPLTLGESAAKMDFTLKTGTVRFEIETTMSERGSDSALSHLSWALLHAFDAMATDNPVQQIEVVLQDSKRFEDSAAKCAAFLFGTQRVLLEGGAAHFQIAAHDFRTAVRRAQSFTEATFHDLALQNGSTYHVDLSNFSGWGRVNKGFSVAAFPERAEIKPAPIAPQDIYDFVCFNAELLAADDTSIGVWNNTADGQVYFDVVRIFSDLGKAKRLGQETNQIAIFDLEKKKEIPTGGDGKVPHVD